MQLTEFHAEKERATKDLKTEIKIVRTYNTELEKNKSTLEEALHVAAAELSAAQEETRSLIGDVREQKRLYRAANERAKDLEKQLHDVKEPAKKTELRKMVKQLTDERDVLAKRVKDSTAISSTVSALREEAQTQKATAQKAIEKTGQLIKIQESLQTQLHERAKEVVSLNDTITTLERKLKAPRKDPSVKTTHKPQKETEARIEKMFTHYDSLHNKNMVLIGKLNMMAQAGGFGNPRSTYRKELEALKAPALEELEEYKERG
ncbi:hypothetical protein N0V94_007470 [Neodidymelliopsis sp. IMI 364377]|nr:hypothetical protein N0V94_007470 [Neodidymelliopsis sp. IMI 364377]